MGYIRAFEANPTIWCIDFFLIFNFLIFLFFCMTNESTDRTMEQHLMVYCCYLNLRGKGATTISFVELLVIKDSMGEYIYLNKNLLEIL